MIVINKFTFSILLLMLFFGCTSNQDIASDKMPDKKQTIEEKPVVSMNQSATQGLQETESETGEIFDDTGSSELNEYNLSSNTDIKKEMKETQLSIPKSFSTNVKVNLTQTYITVESDGMPPHKTGNFPNPTNPNTIEKQNFKFKFPLNPIFTNKKTKLPMGPIGIAFNGVVIYNPYNAEGADAVKAEIFDQCQGHPDPQGRYHYHQLSSCIPTSGDHVPFGLAFDGFVIYGLSNSSNLDECNGHTDEKRGYHYHATTTLPYIIGCYSGIVETSNFDQMAIGGNRPPPRDGQLPPPQ